MKNLKDLKEEIMNKHIQNFYVFYGEDYGLRHHYVEEIKKSFKLVSILENINATTTNRTKTLFKMKTLYICSGDDEFAKLSTTNLANFIKNIKDDTYILCYDKELPQSTLWKEYNDYITYFPTVNDKIAIQFTKDILNINESSREDLIFNCHNNYNNILLEGDKIRNFAEAKNINDQLAYEDLDIKNQLIYNTGIFNVNLLSNDLLKGNRNNYAYWYQKIKESFIEDFWSSLSYIFEDFIIAYFIVKEGSYKGSGKAYDLGLKWNRIKEIKNYIIPYKANDLLYIANEIASLDEKIKTGQISKDELLDYFFCLIV